MFKDKANLIILLIAVIGAVGGFALSRHLAGDATGVSAPGTAGSVAPMSSAQALNDETGQQAPAVVLPDLLGVTRDLQEWRGQFVLVNFWATWCAPCRKEMPELVQLRNTYADQGFEVIGIAIDDPEPAAAMAQELGVNYPVLTSGMAETMPVMTAFGNDAGVLPFSVLIDPQGRVDWVRLGTVTFEEMSELLEARLLDKT